jgi:hypothetical protein
MLSDDHYDYKVPIIRLKFIQEQLKSIFCQRWDKRRTPVQVSVSQPQTPLDRFEMPYLFFMEDKVSVNRRLNVDGSEQRGCGFF